ncbi:hypothetical protein EMIT079MI2_100191 [Bacillus sp. IT-79MI2]
MYYLTNNSIYLSILKMYPISKKMNGVYGIDGNSHTRFTTYM